MLELADQFKVSLKALMLLTEGMRLSPEEAQKLDRGLDEAEDPVGARTKLMGYCVHPSRFDDESAREDARRHALWLIEHAPTSEIVGSPFCVITDEEQAVIRAEELWNKHLEGATDARIYGHAARFFITRDRQKAERLMKRARELDPGNAHWELPEIPEE